MRGQACAGCLSLRVSSSAAAGRALFTSVLIPAANCATCEALSLTCVLGTLLSPGSACTASNEPAATNGRRMLRLDGLTAGAGSGGGRGRVALVCGVPRVPRLPRSRQQVRSRAATLSCGAAGIVESWPMRCRCLFITAAAVLSCLLIGPSALEAVKVR